MDYKNILEGARPFFQGLPAPSSQNATPATAATPVAITLPLIPLAIPNSHAAQETSVIRSKYEEGLGATLSQIYGTGVSSLRSKPTSSLSPQLNSYPTKSPTPHLALRGGSSASASAVSSVAVGHVGSSSPLPLPSAGHVNHTKSGSGSASGGSQPTMVVRRESPLDLSVKTVRQSADSSTSTPTESGTTNTASTGIINIPQLNNNRSLSGSGASTPISTGNTATNNSNSVGSNHVSSVIAAVVNSTTGRDKEYESLKHPSPNIQRLSSSQQQQQHPPAHERVEIPNRTPSQPPPGFSAPAHHLFGHYPVHSPVPPSLAGQYQQYSVQPPGGPDAGGYKLPGVAAADPASNSKPYLSAPPNPVPISTTSSSHQSQSQQRPSSVIPPYNPPTPSFGVYHQGAASHGPIHPAFNHNSHSSYAHAPYQSPHIQQPHQHQIRYPDSYYQAAYGAPTNAPPTSGSSTNSINASVNGTPKPGEVNPYLRNSTPNSHGHQQQQQPGVSTASAIHPQYQSNSGKPSHGQHYGLPPIPASGTPYHHYPQYLPQHLVQGPVQIPGHPNSNANSSGHQAQQQPGTPGQQQQPQSHQYHPGYPNSHLSQNRYGTPQSQQQPRFATPVHVPSPYSYQQQQPGPPRGVSPATPQQPSPHHYSPLYPPHLAGPRQPTPPSQSPTSKQKKSAAITKAQNENSNSASSTNSGNSSHHRNSQGSKGGSSRKNVLNLLRNSLETRIHEKQEKEKTQYSHQTWSFHGRKITLPPSTKSGDTQTTTNGPFGSTAGSGSILTGMSNHSGTPSAGLNGTTIAGAFPDIFGISQRNSNGAPDDEASRAMTFHGSQELSPNADSSLSLNRIRTKAEKKQLFPNLLSQIEQENSNKQNPSAAPRFGQPKSVFDFDDEEDDSKTKIKVNRRSSAGSSNKGSTPPHSSLAPLTSNTSAARKSGSKKFTSKLTKAKNYFSGSSGGSTLTSNAIDAINAVIASASLATQSQSQPHASTSANVPVLGVASSETKAVMSSFSAESLDPFWAVCDSFVDDLAKNPVSIQSKRGGLWAKLKSQQNKSKEKEDNNDSKGGSRKGAMKRVRRNSSEEDEDFEVEKSEEEAEEDEDEEENSNEADDSSHSQDSDADDDDLSVGKKKKKVKQLDDDDDDDENSSTSSIARKNTRSASQNKRGSSSLVGSKRKNSSVSSHISPAKKGKKSKKEAEKKRTSRGIKVGNHTLRERRATNLGLDLVEDDTSRSSIGSVSDDDDSDENVSYSISDDDNSDDSDASTDSSNSEDSESDSDDESDDELRDSDDSESVGKTRAKRTSTAGGSSKGKSSPSKRKSESAKGKSTKTKNGKKGKKSKSKKEEKKGRSLRSGRGGSITRSSGRDRNSESKNETRKLRPKRNCAKAKNEVAEDAAGSSGEEWITHGDLTKRKSRVVFGDGSEFKRPGWEEELIDFKKKLRMPTKLIRVAKPASLTSSSVKEKDKEDMGNVADKSAKENKSPSKTATEEVKPKGRVAKGVKDRTPVKEGKGSKSDKKSEADSLDEPAIEKAVEKMTAAKKKASLAKKSDADVDDQSKKGTKTAKGTPKKSNDAATSSPPAKKGKYVKESAKGAGTKDQGKAAIKDSKGSKSTSKDELTPIVRIEKDPQLLPTPGPAGQKFNKKMSIKSVFGLDPAEDVSPATPAAPVKAKKVLRRNKFKSGFDYLRKKKKPTPTPDGSTPLAPKKAKLSQEKNMSEEDVQAELRGWVLNKGHGETALHRAARLGYVDIAAYALEYGICSPNCKDNAGYTPLHECCIRGNLEVARVLLLYGANPSMTAPGGIRPLHEACENGYVELVRLLVSYGADPLLATYAGQTPLELADQHDNVKRLLMQHIHDVEGKAENLWQFRGSGIWADPHDNGYDATADPPLHASIETIDGFEFEASEAPLPPLYLLKGDTPYVLVQDLVTNVGVPRERLLKNHPAAELVELNSNDFLEEAHCCHLLGEKFNLNSSSDLLSLIKYDDRVKKMLNIESCIIK